MKFEATLSNTNTIFDSSEFDTFEAALEWSMNRGKHYKVNITHGNVSYDFAVVNGSSIQCYDPFSGKWYFVAKEDVKKECGTLLDPDYL